MTDYTKLKQLAEVALHGAMGVIDPQGDFQAAASPATILALIAENAKLQEFKAAYTEWSDKTDWVQATAQPPELGLHRADVLKGRILALSAERDSLKAEVEALRAVLRRVEKCTDGDFMVDGKWRVGDNVMDLVRRTLWPQPAPGDATVEYQSQESRPRTIEVWMEGYMRTGHVPQPHKAMLLGVYQATTFTEAIKQHIATRVPVVRKHFSQHADDSWTYYGCLLFDNEADARRTFG